MKIREHADHGGVTSMIARDILDDRRWRSPPKQGCTWDR
jgi:hypothetical protein